jgi:hypothetical protein
MMSREQHKRAAVVLISAIGRHPTRTFNRPRATPNATSASQTQAPRSVQED